MFMLFSINEANNIVLNNRAALFIFAVDRAIGVLTKQGYIHVNCGSGYCYTRRARRSAYEHERQVFCFRWDGTLALIHRALDKLSESVGKN
jgi:hypothetical protein